MPGKPHDDKYLVFRANDIYMSYNPWSLFTRRLEVKRIVASGAILNLAYNHDLKRWSVEDLKLQLPKSKGGGKNKFPRFIIRDSSIQYQEIIGDKYYDPVSQKFSGVIARDSDNDRIVFNFASEEDTLLPDCQIAGLFDPQSGDIDSEFRFDMENFSAETLPPNLVTFKALYDQIKPRGEMKLKSSYSKDRGNQVIVLFEKASAGINLSGAVVPLPEISGEIICKASETVISSVNVKYQDAEFTVKGKVLGYSSDSEIDLQLVSSNMVLPPDQWDGFDILSSSVFDLDTLHSLSDQSRATGSFKPVLKMLVSAMPVKNKKIFHDLLPTGKADIDFRFVRKDGSNTVAGDIDLVDMSGRFHTFPYPVSGAKGPISIRPGHVTFGPIRASENGQSVEVNGGAEKKCRWQMGDNDRCRCKGSGNNR